jgi:integrase
MANSNTTKSAHLTDTAIRKASYGVLSDPSCPGLRIRIGKEKKRWLYRFRSLIHKDAKGVGKLRELKLGVYPDTSLKDARAKWLIESTKREGGIEPGHTEMSAPYLVRQLCDDYINGYAKKAKRGWREDVRQVDKDIMPVLGDREASSITKPEAMAFLSDIAQRGDGIGRLVMSTIRKAYNYAVAYERVKTNPFARLAIVNGVCLPVDQKPKKDEKEARHLDDRDLKDFLTKLDTAPFSGSLKRIFLLQLLTGARKGEVVNAEWKEIDLEAGTWKQPSEKVKNKTNHKVMLSKQAVAQLQVQKKAAGKSHWVFPSEKYTEVHISVNHPATKLKKNLDHFGIGKFTPHSLRHSVVTGLSRLGCPREVIMRIANHMDSSITGHYDHHSRNQEALNWLQQWANHIDSLTEDNVIPMGGRKRG